MKVAPYWKLRKRQKNLIEHVLRHDLRKASGKENPRKTKSNVIWYIDARRWREWDWLRKAERKSTWQRNLASLRKHRIYYFHFWGSVVRDSCWSFAFLLILNYRNCIVLMVMMITRGWALDRVHITQAGHSVAFLHSVTLWPWPLTFWLNINWWVRYRDGLCLWQVWWF